MIGSRRENQEQENEEMRCINTLKHMKDIDSHSILFGFFYESKQYMVLCPKNSERCECIEVHWDAWNGFSHIRQIVPEEILNLGNAIIRWHDNNNKNYPLKGENYTVFKSIVNGEEKIKIRKEERYSIQSLKRCLPTVIRFMIAIAWAVMNALIYKTTATQLLSIFMPTSEPVVIMKVVWLIELLGSSILFVVCWEHRDPIDTYFNALLPIGLINMIGATKNIQWMRFAIPIAMVGVSIMCYLFIYRHQDMRKTRGKVADAIRLATILISILCLIYSAIAGVPSYAYQANERIEINQTEKQMEEQYLAACERLSNCEWSGYTTQEKLDILQQISDYECVVKLGCESVMLYSGHTERASVLGEYDEANRSVLISQKHLENDEIESVLNTVLHEVRHNYQHRMIEMYQSVEKYVEEPYKDLLVFRDIRTYQDEFQHYCSGEENFESYFEQMVETDSREWAVKRIEEYYKYYIYPDR